MIDRDRIRRYPSLPPKHRGRPPGLWGVSESPLPCPALMCPALAQQTLSLFFAASGASSPKFTTPAAPPASLHPSGSRGYCHECAFPWHPHLPTLSPAAPGTPAPAFPSGASTGFLPCWPQPSAQHSPPAPSPFAHGNPAAYQAFGFSQGGPVPAQALPLAFWMGAGGAAGGGAPLVAAQVQSTLPPPSQGSQRPTAQPSLPVAPPVPAPPPEVGKGEPPVPEGGLQPLPVLQSKESSGSVQREGAADSSSSTVGAREQGESGRRVSRDGGGVREPRTLCPRDWAQARGGGGRLAEGRRRTLQCWEPRGSFQAKKFGPGKKPRATYFQVTLSNSRWN